MMTPFPPKTPMQMRREAEALEKPKRKPKPLPKPAPIDPAKRPVLDGANWSAYLRTGAVESR